MIASLSGVVLRSGASGVVVEVGGVGLAVTCTPQTAMALRVGSVATLHTSLVVREDSLTLFGFDDSDQRDIFEAVQTVSGIGPRIAVAMLCLGVPRAGLDLPSPRWGDAVTAERPLRAEERAAPHLCSLRDER